MKGDFWEQEKLDGEQTCLWSLEYTSLNLNIFCDHSSNILEEIVMLNLCVGFLAFFFFFVDETKSGRWVRKKNWEVSLLGINATETGGKCVDFAYAGYIMLKKKSQSQNNSRIATCNYWRQTLAQIFFSLRAIKSVIISWACGCWFLARKQKASTIACWIGVVLVFLTQKIFLEVLS